jgi:hypothetical protein
VAGGCGDWSAAWAGLRFLATDGNEDSDKLPDIRDASILIARPNGAGGVQLWMLEGRFPAYPLLDSEAAIGCGAEPYLALVRAGVDPLEAMLRVTKQDAFCGDPVQAMAVEPTHEYGALQTFVERPKPARKAVKKKARRK